MSDKIFRLLERLQKLDDALTRAQLRRSALEVARLRAMKAGLKRRLGRALARPAPAVSFAI